MITEQAKTIFPEAAAKAAKGCVTFRVGMNFGATVEEIAPLIRAKLIHFSPREDLPSQISFTAKGFKFAAQHGIDL